MIGRILSGVISVILLAGIAHAQYTFQTVVIPDPYGSTSALRLQDIADNGDMLVRGDGYAARVASGTTVAVPALCASAELALLPQSGDRGPLLVAMNNSGTAVGGAGISNADVAVISTPNGHCTTFLLGAGAFAQDITDNGTVYGYYWGAPFGPEDGLLRFHGFKRAADGTITVLSIPGEPNSRVFPWKADTQGNFIGYAYRDIGADNSYTYQAVVYVNGQYTFLDYTTGEDIACVGWNAAAIVCLVANTTSVIGVPAVLYDRAGETFSLLPLPAGAYAVAPTGMNGPGVLVGASATTVGSGLTATIKVDQIIVTPVVPVTPSFMARFMQRSPSLQKLLGFKAWRGKGLLRSKLTSASPLWQYLTKHEKGEE